MRHGLLRYILGCAGFCSNVVCVNAHLERLEALGLYFFLIEIVFKDAVWDLKPWVRPSFAVISLSILITVGVDSPNFLDSNRSSSPGSSQSVPAR